MAKTYSAPDPEKERSDKQRETKKEKTVGVYDRPKRALPRALLILVTMSRVLIVAAVIALAIFLVMMFLGTADGMETAGTVTQRPAAYESVLPVKSAVAGAPRSSFLIAVTGKAEAPPLCKAG